jgi:hypothetical protein
MIALFVLVGGATLRRVVWVIAAGSSFSTAVCCERLLSHAGPGCRIRRYLPDMLTGFS